jgi:arabinogalactan endo-1,4-beta-galactosidase
MLWPIGEVDVDIEPFSALVANFTNLAALYASARKGVDDAVARGVQKPTVMIHIDDGWNQTLQTRWYGALTATGFVHPADWDISSVSFYHFYGTAATFANLATSLSTLSAKYDKLVMIVETDYPEKCNGTYEPIPALSEPSIPVSVQGQFEWVHNTIGVVRGVPRGPGRGCFTGSLLG